MKNQHMSLPPNFRLRQSVSLASPPQTQLVLEWHWGNFFGNLAYAQYRVIIQNVQTVINFSLSNTY